MWKKWRMYILEKLSLGRDILLIPDGLSIAKKRDINCNNYLCQYTWSETVIYLSCDFNTSSWLTHWNAIKEAHTCIGDELVPRNFLRDLTSFYFYKRNTHISIFNNGFFTLHKYILNE